MNQNSNTAESNATTTTTAKRSKKPIAPELAAVQKAEREYLLHCELSGIAPRPTQLLLLDATAAAHYRDSGSFLSPEQRASIEGESARRERVRATIELCAAARVGENLNAALAESAPDDAEQVPARFLTQPLPMVAVVNNRVVFGTLSAVESTRGRTGGMVPEVTERDGAVVKIDARDRAVSDLRVATIDDVLEYAAPKSRKHKQASAAE